MKQFKKTNVKDKTLNKNMKQMKNNVTLNLMVKNLKAQMVNF